MEREEFELFIAKEFRQRTEAEDVGDTASQVQRRVNVSSAIRRAILAASAVLGGMPAFFVGRLLPSPDTVERAVIGSSSLGQGDFWLPAILLCAVLSVVAAVFLIVRDR